MNNFTFCVPTRIHFGKGQISHLSELAESGSNVLLVYGGGSIKKSGLYDEAMAILADAGLHVVELSGIEPNPRIESVREGARLCKEHAIDMVLAVGGGSVIDAAKVIAGAAKYDGDAWDLVLDRTKIKAALPVYSVLTLAATGSEMDPFAVISDLGKNEKWGTGSPLFVPKMSVLDPTYTFSVSKKQTAAGTADMMSHVFESYFTNVEGATLQAHMSEALLKTLVHYGPIALAEPDNYDARANLMWCGSHAINGLLDSGAEVAWCVHPMEHELSAFYDITHGEGLAILTPVWMKHVLAKDPSKAAAFAEYGRAVFGIAEADDAQAAAAAIECTEDFLFNQMGLPPKLHEVGIEDEENFAAMAKKAAAGCVGSFVPLEESDIVEIYRAAL